MKGQGFFHQAIRQTGVWPDGVTLHHQTSGGGSEETASVGKCWAFRKTSEQAKLMRIKAASSDGQYHAHPAGQEV